MSGDGPYDSFKACLEDAKQENKEAGYGAVEPFCINTSQASDKELDDWLSVMGGANATLKSQVKWLISGSLVGNFQPRLPP